MASFPLHSCLRIASLHAASGSHRLQDQPQDRDSARLGADEETDAAPCAACSHVFGRMVTIMVQMVRQTKDFGRASFDAKAASLALLRIHLDLAPVIG